MATEEFKVNDVVQQKIGYTKNMAVEEIIDDERVKVAWMDNDGNFYDAILYKYDLKKVSDPD